MAQDNKYLQSVGLSDTIKVSDMQKTNNNLILQITRDILIKVHNSKFKNKMLDKIDFVDKNNYTFSTDGVTHNDIGMTAVVYFNNGTYFLQYNDDDKIIHLDTIDTRRNNCFSERITVFYKPLYDKNISLIDYQVINSQCVDGNIQEIKSRNISLTYNDEDKLLYSSNVTSKTIFGTIDNKKEHIIESIYESDSKWRSSDDTHIIGQEIKKYYDKDRDIDECSYYIAKNVYPTLKEFENDSEKKYIDEDEFNSLLNNKSNIIDFKKIKHLTLNS